MAEEAESQSGPSSAPGADWALSAAGRETAEAYLKEQIRLTRLQADDLEREDSVRHWSLRVRHVSDLMKVAFESATALILFAVVALIAGAFWTAAHDNGAVIEAFKVPPDMAQRGLTGDVVASEFLDRLADIDSKVDSARAPATYASSFGNDIKVEIPNTGISISEAYRYLAGWLGHQTHISGEVYHTATGIALTVRISGSLALRFASSEADLDRILAKSAESIYDETQPYRYAVFLTNNGRPAEANTVLRNLALNGPPSEKPWAYALWMYFAQGPNQEQESLARAHKAVELDPDNALAEDNAATAEAQAGHDEEVLKYARGMIAAVHGNGRREVIEKAAIVSELQAEAAIDEEAGDYQNVATIYDDIFAAPDFVGSHWSSQYMQAADAALGHDPEASVRDLGTYTDAGFYPLGATGSGYNFITLQYPQFQRFVALDEWPAARKDLEDTLATKEAKDPSLAASLRTGTWPWFALAEAKTGDLKSAFALIAKTPLDCYLCLRMRGQIEEVAGNDPAASAWFARAAAFAPSVPFADTDWGAMLLREGKYDAAIAKFELANGKGPHFADPLEMWGEALIGKNRSDLALAKFSEADRYAPKWGRLHLKWGEALLWTHDKEDAAKQFALVASLELTPPEKSELARVSHN